MTDDEHHALLQARRRLDAQEEHPDHRALRRRGAMWVWLSLLPLLAGPMAYLSVQALNKVLMEFRGTPHSWLMLPLKYLVRYWLPFTALSMLAWLGFCTARIASITEMTTGRPASLWSRAGILLGTVVLNGMSALALAYVACAVHLLLLGFG